MIKETDAVEVFTENMDRTNMLIEAMEKIGAYNRIYQMDANEKHYELGKAVEKVQNEQLLKIENSCAEHAIISLSTLFETYLKTLVQELFFRFPDYFLEHQSKYSARIEGLINVQTSIDYEEISEKLNLNKRFQYFEFLEAYELDVLTPEDKSFIEYIYIYRNCYVHNAGRIDSKTKAKLRKIVPPIKESFKTTNSKLLRTKMKRLIPKIHDRIIAKLTT
jgi:hypothetical protein